MNSALDGRRVLRTSGRARHYEANDDQKWAVAACPVQYVPSPIIQIAHPWWVTAIVPNLVILWLRQKEATSVAWAIGPISGDNRIPLRAMHKKFVTIPYRPCYTANTWIT